MADNNSIFTKEGRNKRYNGEAKYTEKLAHYIIFLISLGIIGSVCWYLRSVLMYILLSAVFTLLAHPIYKSLRKISIKSHKLPEWLCAALSMITLFAAVGCMVTLLFPVVGGVIADISGANISNIASAAAVPLSEFNGLIVHYFPSVGEDFRVEHAALAQLQKIFDTSLIGGMVGSVTSFITSLSVTIFAVVFISFFFLKTPHMFSKILVAFLPDRYENKLHASLNQIGPLISRYFIGVTIEVAGVSFVNFILLMLVARMGFRYSIGIAFLTGILNIIPYVGPLIGALLGTGLSLTIKYVCATSFGLSVGFLPFLFILLGIFMTTQIIDNYVFQPLIYSNSVKAHPLEIFIVFLIAGQIGGMIGMLAAVPAYTVLKVIAKEFIGEFKPIKRLTENQE